MTYTSFKDKPMEVMPDTIAPGFIFENILYGRTDSFGEPNADKYVFDWLNSTDDGNVNRVRLAMVVDNAWCRASITGFQSREQVERFRQLIWDMPAYNHDDYLASLTISEGIHPADADTDQEPAEGFTLWENGSAYGLSCDIFEYTTPHNEYDALALKAVEKAYEVTKTPVALWEKIQAIPRPDWDENERDDREHWSGLWLFPTRGE